VDNSSVSRLLSGARRGDPGSIEGLLAAIYPEVLRYMRYRVGRGAAGDLAGEVVVRVAKSVARQKGAFTGWLYAIARNVVADHYRRNARRREEPLEDKPGAPGSSGESPASEVNRRMDIEQAMRRLTEDQRELIVLKFVQGLSNGEIGEITGRKQEAIRGLQFRALSALRENLGSEESSDERAS